MPAIIAKPAMQKGTKRGKQEPRKRILPVVFKPAPACRICQFCMADPALKAKIEGSRSFVPLGTAIRPLLRELAVNPPTWYNHLKFHHYPEAERRTPLLAVPADSVVERVQHEVQGHIINQETAIRDNFEKGWDEIINRGMEDIAKGHIAINGTMLIKALADKATFVAKKQDRKLDAAKMMFAFASGAKQEPDKKDAAPATS